MDTAVFQDYSAACKALIGGESATLSYYIVKTRSTTGGGGSFVYSLLCVLSKDHEISESEFVYDVTRTEKTAVDLMKMLCDNTVTPCSLRYVLGDLL